MWLKGKRSLIQRDLQIGKKVPGWKLVKCKKGARAWVKETLDAATAVMKKLLKKGAFTEPELLSPTQAQAALKKLKRADDYAKLAEFITQADGGEHVAAETDDGEAIVKPDVSLLLDADGDLL